MTPATPWSARTLPTSCRAIGPTGRKHITNRPAPSQRARSHHDRGTSERRGDMTRVFPVLVCATILAGATTAFGQQNVIATSRSIDWEQAGVPGGIQNRTIICQQLSPGATAEQINAAIAACPSGQVVYLAAGTYNL